MEYIDTIDDAVQVQSQEDFAGGADEFTRPKLLAPNVSGRLVNCLVEDTGRPRVRPGADALGGAALAAGRIEALTYFDTPTLEYVYASVLASLRQWNGTTWTNLAGYPFAGNSIVEQVQGNHLLYLSDGVGQWRTHDGTNFSAALGTTTADPPNGARILCWHTFRMFATGNFGGFNDQIYVSALGNAGAGQWNHATWAFRVGRGEGQAITALASAKGWWLCVGKESSIYMVNTDPTKVSAAEWTISRLAGGMGVVGKRALLSFGDFLLLLGRDGVRRIRATDAIETPFEIEAPLSQPMQPYINRINWVAASKSVLHKYLHYALVAVPLDAATEPSHVLVYNTRLDRWMGVWSGWTPTAMATSSFASVDRLLVGDSIGRVNQWKDFASSTDDATYRDNATEVPTVIRSASWFFGLLRNWKDGHFIEVQFVDSTANATLIAVGDGIEIKRWSENLLQVQNMLPVNLPFDLAVNSPRTITKSLDGLPEFKNLFLEVQTEAGQVSVEAMAAAAFINPLTTDE